MRHSFLLHAAIVCAVPFLAACPGSDARVQVFTEGADEDELAPVGDAVVEFLPFDRDSVFEALAATAEEPEPEVPPELQAAFDSVAELQDEWREVETRWSEVRDTLRQLSNRLQGMDPRGSDYRRLYERFDQLETRERQLNQQRTQAFERFDRLQRTSLARADSIRAIREAWEDVAFSDYAQVVDSIQEARGREIRVDTTNADGVASARLSGSPWWVHTRVSVPFGELYWNVPLDAEADTMRLTPENAERRLRL